MPNNDIAASPARPKPNRRQRPPRREAAVTHPPLAPAPTAPPRGEAPSGETRLRFQLASLARISDNIVSRAVRAYDSLFALDRKDQAEVYLEMGKDLVSRGKLEQALEVLRKAAKLRPDSTEPLLEIGLLHLRQQAPEAAVRVLEQAKERGGPSYEIHRGLSEALIMLGKYQEALTEIQAAVGLKPGVAEDHYRLGVALDRTGRYDDAVLAFGRAIELAPHEVLYHQSLGFTLESAGRRRDAIKCFKRALELERPATNSSQPAAR
jgi:Flp pilus assembly protein TadD